MNNTSRFKFYGILTILILVVVGVVWFYPREHSSKIPHVNRVVTPKSSQRPIKSPTPQTNQNAQIREFSLRTGIVVTNGTYRNPVPYYSTTYGEILHINERDKLDLSPEQIMTLQREYTAAVDKRLQVEAELAEITITGENSYKVVIPQYDIDTSVRGKFYAVLDEILASANLSSQPNQGIYVTPEQKIQDIHGGFEILNWSWGLAPQILTINYKPDADLYEIGHSYTQNLDGTGGPSSAIRTGAVVKGTNPTDYYYIINKIKSIQGK